MQEPIDTSAYVKIQLDWPSYYKKFKEIHGLYPVKYKGRLLFEDGWTYSATDLAGPEYPPPNDIRDLWKIRVAYWALRRRIVKHERDYITKMIENLRLMQSTRHIPLQQQVIKKNEDTGYPMIEYEDLEDNLKAIEQVRLQWLARDIDQCDEKLKELRANKPKSASIEEERLVAD